jgi:hypothetical protein
MIRGGGTLSNEPVYWDSSEAAKLFGFNQGEDVHNKLGERVTLLKGAIQKPDGYKTGMIIPQYSLTTLMESYNDFKNEMSQLEFVCHSLGGKALITTKYHAEFAGEGIEYSWGLSKVMYRKNLFYQKRVSGISMLWSPSAYQGMC